jgi:hypothetical protein
MNLSSRRIGRSEMMFAISAFFEPSVLDFALSSSAGFA